MNVLIAPDAFKDSLTASEVAQAMKMGVLAFSKDANCFELSASDGGEGFLKAIGIYVKGAKTIETSTVDPLGRSIQASYLYDEKEKTAYVELAQASGLELLANQERNPMQTSTFGTGNQMKHAIEGGATTVYLGLGGSATNDAATGIAHALGFRFLDRNGGEMYPVGGLLNQIETVERPAKLHSSIRFFAVNDVLNPLYGPTGAAYVYGPQKGANPDDVIALDKGLRHLDAKMQDLFAIDEAMTPGAGAAGGTAYGLKSFLGATFLSGTAFVLELANFGELVVQKKIDVIITGEGKIDQQTAYGKFVHGIVQQAKAYDIPVLAVCGKLDATPNEIQELGISAVAQLYNASKPPSYSYEHAAQLISKKTEALLRNL